MAAFAKYTNNAVYYELRHNTREYGLDKHGNPKKPKNVDIDELRTHLNYFLTPPDRGTCARDNKNYYNQLLSSVYHYNRADVKTACQWVITAPKDLPKECVNEFFEESYNFLNSLYGEQFCIQCIVHFDEGVKNDSGAIIAGQPHMHYTFIPVVETTDKNPNHAQSHFTHKVCADKLINKSHLQKFHKKFQDWLYSRNIPAIVYKGGSIGKGKTVEQLKNSTREMEHKKSIDKIRQLEQENSLLKTRITELEQQISHTQNWGTSTTWGETSIDKETIWNQEF